MRCQERNNGNLQGNDSSGVNPKGVENAEIKYNSEKRESGQ